MDISLKIESLINELSELKPKLSANSFDNTAKFNSILTTALGAEPIQITGSDKAGRIDNSYTYDHNNPRKPNIRELIEKLSGRSIEDLYSDPDSNWHEYSKQASELLYGVVGSGEDTRDWSKIMSSSNTVKEANSETNRMHSPIIAIENDKNEVGTIISQYAVLKSSSGNLLRKIDGSAKEIGAILDNFGVFAENVPADLENKITSPNFNSEVLAALRKLPPSDLSITNEEIPENLQELAFETTLDAIAGKLGSGIPIDELEKL